MVDFDKLEGAPLDRDQIISLIRDMVAAGNSMATVRRRLLHELPLRLTQDHVNAAEAEFERQVGIIRSFPEPAVAADDEQFERWYTGPRPTDRFWPALEHFLHGELPPDAVGSVDQASTKIVSYLAPPGLDGFSTRGLVLGFVQSGKTTNFAGVVAKAADAGYRLFVVLSGMHNSLRAQTHIRLQRYLYERHPHQWHMLSDTENDFVNPGDLNVDRLLADTDMRLLIVVKKNAARLRAVRSWLDAANRDVLARVPILVVDDEADQASIDTTPRDDREKRTRINDLIIQLLDLRKASYVGYTASPFANLLIDPSVPEQLYPRDFIVDLPRPNGYFGPERLFGRERITQDEEDWESDGLDMIRRVPDSDVTLVRPPSGRDAREAFVPQLPESLRSAIRYFVLATAARRFRGSEAHHSTMLIHTTLYSDIQNRMQEPVMRFITALGNDLATSDPEAIADLNAHWTSEVERLPPEAVDQSLERIAFQDLLEFIAPVLADIAVKVDNYKSEDRLDYTGGHKIVIVIGGNTLSRGLTLEGLVVSYFVRTASAYDTLLQMGRWFGYRRGYEDLPRIWMTRELEEQFMALATVEAEIRDDIARYEAEGITPRELAVKIRTHPKLAITAAMKMQAAFQVHVSYSGRRLQTILFEHRDSGWLRQNLEAARTIIASSDFDGSGGGKWLAKDVPASRVLEFFDSYRFHEESRDLRNGPVAQYIEAQMEFGELEKWNIGIVGQSRQQLGGIDLGLPSPVNLISRSDTTPDGYANVKTLMSRPDSVMDLELPASVAQETWSKQLPHRPGGIGLLLLYPISRDSTPRRHAGKKARYALNAVDDIIGVGLCFPVASRSETAQTYVAAPLEFDYSEEFSADIEESE